MQINILKYLHMIYSTAALRPLPLLPVSSKQRQQSLSPVLYHLPPRTANLAPQALPMLSPVWGFLAHWSGFEILLESKMHHLQGPEIPAGRAIPSLERFLRNFVRFKEVNSIKPKFYITSVAMWAKVSQNRENLEFLL